MKLIIISIQELTKIIVKRFGVSPEIGTYHFLNMWDTIWAKSFCY